MRKVLSLLLLFLVLFTFGCSGGKGASELKSAGVVGQTFYSQFTLHYEKNIYKTVNYRKGNILPVNSAVEVIAISGNEIKLKLINSGAELKVINTEKFSGEDLKGIFKRLLSQQPIDLSGYDAETLHLIQMGRTVKGMDKKTVIMALGYPPKHETVSLDQPVWKYWRNRFVTFQVSFDGRGLLMMAHR